MKSKKLFAILTLTMFMMTLLPMAAFAADPYSFSASEVKPATLSMDVYADPTDLAKITLTFEDKNGNALAASKVVEFYIKSDRDTEVGYVQQDGNPNSNIALSGAAMGTGDGQFISAEVAAGGKVYVYVGSPLSGTFTISIYNMGATLDDARLIGSTKCTVSVGEGDVVLYGVNEDNAIYNDYDDANARFDSSPASYDLDANGDPIVKAGDGIELKAVVEDGGVAIEDKEVTFQYKYEGGSWFTLDTEVTDEDGEAVYYFEQTKTGTYEYRASIGPNSDDKSNVIKLEVRPVYTSGAFAAKTLELITADGTKVAKAQDNYISFYVKDKYGNLIKDFATSEFAVKFDSAPAGSRFEDQDWEANGPTDARVDVTYKADGKVRIKFKPDKLGAYTLKLRSVNDTRVNATINVEAVDFNKATSLKFVLKNNVPETVTSLARVYTAGNKYYNEVNDVAGKLLVYAVNDAGVELQKTDGVTLSSPDTGKVTVSNDSGKFGEITIKSGAAGVYTLTAYYAADNIVATYDLNVVGSPKSLAVTPTVTGKNATISIQYVDANGENTFTNDADGSEAFVVSVPTGVSATNFKNINKVGKGTFDLQVTEYGKYNVTVITDEKKIAKTFEVEFVMPASEKPVIGAKTVTMFIGATGYVQDSAAKVTDVAPFIQDSRTFVAVRPVADAFGCEIGWNEATQTVTLTRADKVVTIVIGSNVITVVEGGVTTTVEADVAAFIKDGRTVLPFRAVGDAFGAAVSYDAATQAVSYIQ